MKDLAINRALGEDTRLQEILINGEVFSLHKSHNDEIIISDTYDYTKIYAVFSRDFWKFVEE